MVKKVIVGLLLAGVSLVGLGCGDATPPQVTVQNLPIINGETDTSNAHLAVVGIQSGAYLCTGTLISRDVILTAGHCVDSISLGNYSVRFSTTTMYQAEHTRGVSERIRHPRYNADYVLNDIAMLRLDEAAPAGVEPIPFLPAHLAITDADLGMPIEFVGFGQTEAGTAGRKMHYVGEIKWICEGPDYCHHSNGVYGMPGTLCFDQELGGTCSGDSGGPGLVQRDGQWYVAAITSYGDPDGCELYGCSTKVDQFQEFISDFTGGGLGSVCASADECVFGHCVDGVCCDSACETACMSCNRIGSEGRCVTAENGSTCSDSDVCNGDEVCLMGDCVAGAPLECPDNGVCSNDICHPTQGCISEAQPDGYACGDCMMCVSGQCEDSNCKSGCASAAVPSPISGRGQGGLLLLAFFGIFAFALRRF